jgi:hypothetical protein
MATVAIKDFCYVSEDFAANSYFLIFIFILLHVVLEMLQTA